MSGARRDVARFCLMLTIGFALVAAMVGAAHLADVPRADVYRWVAIYAAVEAGGRAADWLLRGES